MTETAPTPFPDLERDPNRIDNHFVRQPASTGQFIPLRLALSVDPDTRMFALERFRIDIGLAAPALSAALALCWEDAMKHVSKDRTVFRTQEFSDAMCRALETVLAETGLSSIGVSVKAVYSPCSLHWWLVFNDADPNEATSVRLPNQASEPLAHHSADLSPYRTLH